MIAAPTSRGRWWPWLIVLFLVAWWARDSLPRLVHGPMEPRVVNPRGDLADEEKATIELFEAASVSVVYISRIDHLRSPFSRQVEAVETGTGSGFIWDETGNVVTNYHVIAGADSLVVTLFDGSTTTGVVVGQAEDKDLAVVRIDAPAHKLRPIPVGTSSDLRVGQSVFAIGNPFGLDFTLTTGVVSALNREIRALTGRSIHGVVQTDAAINPGNSGGPLLDSAGRLIGINTAIHSPSGASSGISFAVPVDVVNDVVPQLIAYGRVIRPGLGVEIFSDTTSRRVGLQGVLIRAVLPGSAAQRAGLLGIRALRDGGWIGDVIVAIDGKPIESTDQLMATLEGYRVSDTVKLTFRRQALGASVSEEHTVDVTLQAIE